MEIRELPDYIIDQIAAGEVIEKPSFVVKELVENSIDANSSEIEIKIFDAGKKRIIVTDDGDGISKDNIKKSIKRHATSKLKNEDLFNVNFLGFRGEALPSIASVSQFQLESKSTKEDQGWGIKLNHSKFVDMQPSSRVVGTKVTVSDLFKNIPARLKFLKTNVSENNSSIQIIKKLAMINHLISFKLFIDNKMVLNLKKENDNFDGKKLRVSNILGYEFISSSLLVNKEKKEKDRSIKISGYISIPSFNKSSQLNQFIFVNGRPIQDRGLSAVIRFSYKESIEKGRHPVYCIYINVPKNYVDVNVHPTKMEVRFKDYQLIKSLIISSITNTLQKNRISSKEIEENNFQNTHQQTNPKYQFNPQMKFNNEFSIKSLDEKTLENQKSRVDSSADLPLGVPIYQFNKNYIISIADNEIKIIDQHAAHERIVFENIKANLKNKKQPSQIMLLPIVIDLNVQQFEIFNIYIDLFNKLGFEIEEFGRNSILIRAIPLILNKYDIRTIVTDLIDDMLVQGLPINYEDKINNIIANIACHKSIRSGRELNIEEMNELLRKMETTPNSNECNHGRPTSISLSLDKIEKLFHRK